jgi:hypothetical protein
MLHEYGHFLDDVLHEKAGIKGDSEGEEGKAFASRFLEYSSADLFNTDFVFADFVAPDANDEEQRFDVGVSDLSYEQRKAIECIFEFSEDLGTGNLKLPSGTDVGNVEFFGLVNLTNATSKTHQNLTITGAKAENVSVNDLLTDGSIWPDFPARTHLETNIPVSLITLARKKSTFDRDTIYESHYGKYQYWHSMCPKLPQVPTNREVVKLIMDQAEEWYSEAIKNKKENKTKESLFALGKLCHTVQDSFVLAHCWRRYVGDEEFIEEEQITSEENGKIWTFQDYKAQNGDFHAFSDAPLLNITLLKKVRTIGYQSAENATKEIMARYAKNLEWHEIKDYVGEIYELCKGRENQPSGGSHPWFSKNCRMSSSELKIKLSNFSSEVKEC